jgi:hypothetical protein
MLELPHELTVCRRIDSTDQLRVQSGVHGARLRDVHGLCSGEVQDSHWLERMHLLRPGQVLRDYGSYCIQHVLIMHCRQVFLDERREHLHQLRHRNVLSDFGQEFSRYLLALPCIVEL